MSASERLAALSQKHAELTAGGLGWAETEAIEGRLIAALPEIVALVQAAEGCFRIDQPSWNEVEHRMAVALAALGKKLGT